MNPQLTFWIFFIVLLFIVLLFDRKYNMLKDISTANKKPYSFSRVQLAWWTVIILSSFITIITLGKGIPTFDQSTLILLGISAITTGSARIIDISDKSNNLKMIQDKEKENFILDILSDANGVSIHRFQAAAFNIVFGVWFIISVLYNVSTPALINPEKISFIMPLLDQNNLILLGLSSGAYAVLKTTENK